MDESQGTGLLNLPNELLDRIISFLAPKPEDRSSIKWIGTEEADRESAVQKAAWKKDIQALRLTCRRISDLRTTKAALFYDLTLYVSKKSLDNFRALAERDDLRHHVRCIIFMRPQAPSIFSDPGLFTRLSRYTMRLAYDAAFEASSLSTELRSRQLPWNLTLGARVIEQLLDDHWTEPETQKRTFRARQLYSSVADEEQHLFKSGIYVQQAAQYLSLCINVESVIICNGDGRHDVKSWLPHAADNAQPSWLEKNYPRIGLKSNMLQTDGPPPEFQARIFDVLARSHATIRHLMFSQEMAWHPSFDPNPYGTHGNKLTWSHLQELKLMIYDDYENAVFWTDGMHTSLLPFLRLVTSTLRSLHLSCAAPFQDDPIEYSRSSFDLDKVLAVDFTYLTELHLCAFNINCRLLASLIGKRPAMRTLELITCIGGDGLWPILFKCLHRHPQAMELSFRDNVGTNFGDEFTIISSKNLEVGVDELYDYLHKKGEWTKELEEMFGQMSF